MRVGLALGAGGILGAAWMIGALDALERDGGLRPAQLAEILATSVGSLIAVMVAAGVPTDAMAAYAAGESGGALEPLENHDATALTLTRLPLSPRPGSLSMALRARGGAGRLTGLLPRGVVSTEGIASLVRRVVGERWPEAVIRVVACDYASGERVELGRGASPPVRRARRWPHRAPFPASTRRSRSAGATSSTGGPIRIRTSTYSPARSSTP